VYSAIRLAVAWLAAWCQVLVVAVMPFGPMAQLAGGLERVPICHADNEQPDAPQPAHADHDCVLCAMCQLDSGPLVLLPQTTTLAARQNVAVVRFGAASIRAPPPQFSIAAQPRGPPSLI
jgi:Protein of unknown function (DUF2946)